MDKAQLIVDLIRDEGVRLTPYPDTAGHLTIGIGRNLDVGITPAEAQYMLENDIAKALTACGVHVGFFSELSEGRQRALVNLCFNLGWGGLVKFKKFLLALEKGDYASAAKELLASNYAKQVGERAKRLALQIEMG